MPAESEVHNVKKGIGSKQVAFDEEMILKNAVKETGVGNLEEVLVIFHFFQEQIIYVLQKKELITKIWPNIEVVHETKKQKSGDTTA